ncbi:MAG: sulfatase-like hydrolase/transferase [Pseudomonadota bacterium]
MIDRWKVAEATGRARLGWPQIVAALVLLNLLLVLPDRPSELTTGFPFRIAPELPFIMLALVLVRGWPGTLLRWAVVLFVVASMVFSVADLVMRASLDRPFKPLLDLHLASAGWDLVAGAVGPFSAALIAIALGGGLVLGAIGCIWATRRLASIAVPVRRNAIAGAAGVAAVATVVVAAIGLIPIRFEASNSLVRHAEQMARDIEVRRAFAVDTAPDRFSEAAPSDLLAGLAGRDVLLLFVESYGRSAIEDPRYRPTVGPALGSLDNAVTEVGAGIRSAWLTSPISGGQSWLAHATLLSGLWVDSQRRYDALLTSGRQTLVHAFADAGWRTVAVMPAISQAWPQGTFYGYDRIYAAADLGYAGDPFNWVTMPDQYTLSALERLELAAEDRAPVMAEVALISSHAPWTPIAELVPWDEVGDGSVFNRWANEGDPPAVVWQDFDRVRAQYVLAVEYAIRTLASYLQTHLDDDTVVVILGDHQPAPLITGEDASRDVPVHIISRDSDVLSALQAWDWADTADLTPAAPVWRMDEFRDAFLDAFTPSATSIASHQP